MSSDPWKHRSAGMNPFEKVVLCIAAILVISALYGCGDGAGNGGSDPAGDDNSNVVNVYDGGTYVEGDQTTNTDSFNPTGGASGTIGDSSCSFDWEYTPGGQSGIIIGNCVGMAGGTYEGTCSDGTVAAGSFACGEDIDPCPADSGDNTTTFTGNCTGISETVTFDSRMTGL